MQTVHAGFEKIQSEQLARVSTSFLRLRPKLLAPIGPVLLGLMWWSDVPRAEFIAIASTFGCMLGWFSFEAWAVKRAAVTRNVFCGSLLLTIFGLALLCGFSGGSRSPFLPIVFAPVGIAFAAFGKERRTAYVFGAFVTALGYLSLSTTLWSWALPERLAQLIAVVASVLSATLLYFGITGLASAYRETAQSLERTRADVLQSAEAQTRSLQSLGSRVAHELKNPLASIKGLVQLVTERAESTRDDRSVERLSVVLQEVSRMEQILGEYLDFTRPLGSVELKLQPLRPFLLEFCKLLEGEAHQRKVTLTLDCPSLELSFDAQRLRQALLNLSQNALAAMPDGGNLRLLVQADGDSVEVAVCDDGAGMSEEVLARVKEPYFSARKGGTGLGVVIADGIARGHSGSLRFESRPGAGTRAILRLRRVSKLEQLP